MAEGLEELANMEYPGRVIIIGKSEWGGNVVVYGLSGRSPPSQARRLVKDDDKHSVSIQVIDPEQLKTGDPALLVYNVIRTHDFASGTVVVSNGSQTDLIYDHCGGVRPICAQTVLPLSFIKPYKVMTKDGREIDITSFEPDSLSTPRISGIISTDSITPGSFAMLNITSRDANGSPLRRYYEVPLLNGHGKMIATYDGPNPQGKEPVPSFRGEPRDVSINIFPGVDHFVEAVYEAMGQFVVSVACLVDKGGYRKEITIKNKF